MAPKWSRDKVVLLIEFYKNHRFLWDPDNVNYFKNHKRDEVLEELKSHLGDEFTLYYIREKFRSLRSIYGRELKKYNMLTAAGKPFKSRWEFFERMKFIHKYITLGIKGGKQWRKLKLMAAAAAAENRIEQDAKPGGNDESQEENSQVNEVLENVETQLVENQLVLQPGDVLVLPGNHDDGSEDHNDYDDSIDLSKFLRTNSPLPASEITQKQIRKRPKIINISSRNKSEPSDDIDESVEYHFAKLVASQLRTISNPYNKDMAMLEIQQVLINHKFKCGQ